MAGEPLTAAEIDEGWVAEPCGCAYHPGNREERDVGGGYTVVSSGFCKRYCQKHIDKIMREREQLRYRLFEAPDEPTPNALERWKMRNR